MRMIPRLRHNPGINKKIGHRRLSARLKNRTSSIPRNPLCCPRKSPATTLPRLEPRGMYLVGGLVMPFKMIRTIVKNLITRSLPFVKPRPYRHPCLELLVPLVTHHPNVVAVPDNDVAFRVVPPKVPMDLWICYKVTTRIKMMMIRTILTTGHRRPFRSVPMMNVLAPRQNLSMGSTSPMTYGVLVLVRYGTVLVLCLL
jgi:hypothetical protein